MATRTRPGSILAALLATLTLLGFSLPSQAARCLFINSYHPGYAWSDAVEEGALPLLEGKCELKVVYMDTKRHKEKAFKEQKGREIRDLILTWKPDVVIACDDNASKYVVVPWFKDGEIPFVFCGVNWSVKEYGYPFTNVTGMVEIAPVGQLLSRAIQFDPANRRFIYLGADTLTERKNLGRFEVATRRIGVRLDSRLVGTLEEWIAAYREAQGADVLILGSFSGIKGWDAERARRAAAESVSTLVITNHDWMMPYAVFGMTKVPQEHGEWAAKVALRILEGESPSSIPIIPNRRWDLFVNMELYRHSGIVLPENLLYKAKQIDDAPGS